MKKLILICLLFFIYLRCDEQQPLTNENNDIKCVYEVYQNGVLIDTLTKYELYHCLEQGNCVFSNCYYKLIKAERLK